MESLGPDGKIRGNAMQIWERYTHQAQECSDPVKKETLRQMAEHYRRVSQSCVSPFKKKKTLITTRDTTDTTQKGAKNPAPSSEKESEDAHKPSA